MADDMVLMAQRFVNSYYGSIEGIPVVEEDGQTGWATMYALTRCLQYELGLTALSDTFGPTTLATLTSKFPVIGAGAGSTRIVQIVQAALYCKGYDGGEIQDGFTPGGMYTARVSAAVTKLKTDCGVYAANPNGNVFPKLFKALLTMDAYVVVGNGSSTIRSIQQWLNATYHQRGPFFIIPCDGSFSRDVQKALMLAVQFQVGISDASANGVFGPTTQAGIRANPLSVGSSGRWVQLFTAAMVFNRRSGVAFSDSFSSALSAQVSSFQDFVALPVTGRGDFQTWASLLVSTGDTSRRGRAVDCVTSITYDRADTLKANGYDIVGRYLSNVPGTSLNKMIDLLELGVIENSGLRCFPIYQTYGDSAGYFSTLQGKVDAYRAIDRAKFYGFKPGTRIYFAVDFDALDSEVTSRVIPHFRGITEVMDEYGSQFRIGVYGPRNICSRVAAAGLSSASFVSDMSTGYSGNLGYPMPDDWAFDQISTISIGSGAGKIEIDNNIVSGRDLGQSSFLEGEWKANQDVNFDSAQLSALTADIRRYLESQGIGENSTGRIYSTTEAVKIVMGWDAVITEVARTLRLRKALIVTPILWETRMTGLDDPLGDAGVIQYHTGFDWDPTDKFIVRDCSTGLGQIFAWVAIRARNYMINSGFISGALKDASKDSDIWEVWQKLHYDQSYNINAATHNLVWSAYDLNLPRPNLEYTEEQTRLVLRRYQGFLDPNDPENNEKLERESRTKLGLYQVLENYFAPLRA
jgi:peptidoglycan hydrolase-like protein with peptidoglycan-binding domain